MKIRWIGTLLGLAFAVTVAVIVGLRLSTEAMAVLVGVIAGVAASIPTSLIVVWLATRHLNSVTARTPQTIEPRVIYVSAAPPQAPTYISTLTPPNGSSLAPRRFMGLDDPAPADALPCAAATSVTVIGGADEAH